MRIAAQYGGFHFHVVFPQKVNFLWYFLESLNKLKYAGIHFHVKTFVCVFSHFFLIKKQIRASFTTTDARLPRALDDNDLRHNRRGLLAAGTPDPPGPALGADEFTYASDSRCTDS